MSNIKYAITTGHLYLHKDDEDTVKLFDTYQEALAVYNSSSLYKKVVEVVVEVKPVIVQGTNIVEASHLISRLSDRSLVVVIREGNNKLPKEFTDCFTNILYTSDLSESFVIDVLCSQASLVVVNSITKDLFQYSDLILLKTDSFYRVDKFKATTRYSNEHTLIDLAR